MSWKGIRGEGGKEEQEEEEEEEEEDKTGEARPFPFLNIEEKPSKTE